MDQVDCIVVGAGVVGLATARALALSGREVLVLERNPAFGMETSSRNSEVIHAGMYYPTGSLKARWCVQGREMLYHYSRERGIAHRVCGKFIVATAATQLAQLEAIRQRGIANGVDDLVWLDAAAARAMEPALQCVAALHSPSTGIIDSHGLMLSLLGDIENAGGLLVCNSAVERMECAQGAIDVIAFDGTALRAKTVVNAAGLYATALAARTQGLDARHIPPTFFAKGNYFALSGRSPFSRLIYPVPEAAGLGVHLTLDLAGQARFGPDVEWVDSPADTTVNPARADAFYAEVRHYWRDLPDGALQSAYAGIRPKISAPHEAARDFCIQGEADHGIPGLVNLFGIESPGLTSALAIGAFVAALTAASP